MLRRYLHKLICWVSGHMWISPKAVPAIFQVALHKDADAICIRCSAPLFFIGPLADSVFSPSPLLTRLREKGDLQHE